MHQLKDGGLSHITCNCRKELKQNHKWLTAAYDALKRPYEWRVKYYCVER